MGSWSAAAMANATSMATRKVTMKNFILGDALLVLVCLGGLSRSLQTAAEAVFLNADTLEIRRTRKGFSLRLGDHSDAPG